MLPNAATFQARLRATAAASRAAGEARPGLALRRVVTQCRHDGCPPGLGAYRVAIKAAAGGARGGGGGGGGRVKSQPSNSRKMHHVGNSKQRKGGAKEQTDEEGEAYSGKRQRMLGPPTSDQSSSSGDGLSSSLSASTADTSSQAIALGRAADCEALCWMAIADGVALDTACVNALLCALANAGAAHKAVSLLSYLAKATSTAPAAAAAAAGEEEDDDEEEEEEEEQYDPWSGLQFTAGTRADGASFSFALAATVESDRSDAEMLAAAAPAVALLESFLLPPSLPLEGKDLECPRPLSETAAATAERLADAARGYLTPRGLRALDAIHSTQATEL